MYCPACGEQIADGARFCTMCGSRTGTASSDTGGTLSGGQTEIRRAPDRLEPGTLFHDRYEIEELIGQGGMGLVYRAKDRLTGEVVCVKTIRPGPGSSDSLAQRFLREGTLSRSLRHENIVSVYDVNAAGDVLYLTMEHLRGEPLRNGVAPPVGGAE